MKRFTATDGTNLYVAQDNGLKKIVISTGASSTLNTTETFKGLAFGGSTLYGFTQCGLYTIHTTTGVATKVISIDDLQTVDYISADYALVTSLNSLIKARTTADTATGTAVLTTETLTSVTITNDGYYSTAPTVTITGGGGSGATAEAVLTNAKVTGVTITAAGSGYTSVPTVTFSAGIAGELTYLSHTL